MSAFGDEPARWMAARRIGVNEFARVSHYSAGYISNLRSGKKSPAPQTAAEFDALLRAGGELAAKAPSPLDSGPTDDHGPHLPDIRRRDYLTLSASVLALLDVLRTPSVPDLADRVAAAVAGRSRIDDETVDGLAQITLGYRMVYRSVGAAALLSPVCGTLNLLIEIAPDAGIYRDRLVSLISEAGSVAAVVLMFDQGDFPTAG